ncbi:Kinesin-like protein KIN-14Q [Glycine max]|nr:Kinesin-like protein KIN-14Q [Glycine max]
MKGSFAALCCFVLFEHDSLEEQSTQGSFVPFGRDDILNMAIGRPEHPGRVRAAGTGVTISQYFGPASRQSTTLSNSITPEQLADIIGQIKEAIKLELSQIASQQSPPLQAHDIQLLAARVSTKGSCAALETNALAKEISELHCDSVGLHVTAENSTKLVAVGTQCDNFGTIHNVPYADDVVRVSVVKVIFGDVEVPIPTLEIKFVKEDLGSFVPWPTYLVKPMLPKDPEKAFSSPLKTVEEEKASVVVDPLGDLVKNLFDIYQRPVELSWYGTKFGINNVKDGFFITHADVTEIVLGDKCLNISILQLWLMFIHDWSSSIGYGALYGFLEPQCIHNANTKRQEYENYIGKWLKEAGKQIYIAPYLNHAHWQLLVLCLGDNLVVRFCSLRKKPNAAIKGAVNRVMFKQETTSVDTMLCTGYGASYNAYGHCSEGADTHFGMSNEGIEDIGMEAKFKRLKRDFDSQRKKLTETRRELGEIKRENQQKSRECQEAWNSLKELQNELMCKSMHVGSLAFAIEGQVKDKSKWFSSLRNFTRKLKIMKMEHIKLLEEAEASKKYQADMREMGLIIKSKINEQLESHEDLKSKYIEGATERKDLYNKVLELRGNIRVFCHCRSFNTNEIYAGATMALDFESMKDGDLTIMSNGAPKKTFKFDVVFGPQAEQADIFKDTTPFATSVLEGFNVCIFAYGQTGTGKTFTIEGTKEAQGVNFRTLEKMFDIIKERHKLYCYNISGENLLNGECTRSKLWLMDLVGSERVAKTEVHGDGLKETQNINRSLSALGDVISALATKSSHIPFRNSKLTHLLQDSLGGDSKALMFVQISPNENYLSETICSLNFASRVRGIELGPARKQLDTVELLRHKQMVEKVKQEVRLKDLQIKKLEETIHGLESKMKERDKEFVPHVDLLLFVISVDHPLTGSEVWSVYYAPILAAFSVPLAQSDDEIVIALCPKRLPLCYSCYYCNVHEDSQPEMSL